MEAEALALSPIFFLRIFHPKALLFAIGFIGMTLFPKNPMEYDPLTRVLIKLYHPPRIKFLYVGYRTFPSEVTDHVFPIENDIYMKTIKEDYGLVILAWPTLGGHIPDEILRRIHDVLCEGGKLLLWDGFNLRVYGVIERDELGPPEPMASMRPKLNRDDLEAFRWLTEQNVWEDEPRRILFMGDVVGWTDRLAEAGMTAYGVGTTDAEPHYANVRGHYEHLPFKPLSFKIIYVLINHATEVLILAEIDRLLIPDGYLIIDPLGHPRLDRLMESMRYGKLLLRVHNNNVYRKQREWAA